MTRPRDDLDLDDDLDDDFDDVDLTDEADFDGDEFDDDDLDDRADDLWLEGDGRWDDEDDWARGADWRQVVGTGAGLIALAVFAMIMFVLGVFLVVQII